MSDVIFSSDLTVNLRRASGDDLAIIEAAKVSTGSDDETEELTPEKIKGLINYLMKKRHGSPFEHGSFTFRITAPIFVWREFMRHRIASYNEQSARYMMMEPRFFMYPEDRALVQTGSSAHPNISGGTEDQRAIVTTEVQRAGEVAWESYLYMLNAGVANEVARIVLPVGLYSSAYVTMNPRALMNFLSLRVDSEDATYETKPQAEIQRVAEQMEAVFAEHYPITHASFVANGRVAP